MWLQFWSAFARSLVVVSALVMWASVSMAEAPTRTSGAEAQGRRHALIVGTANYRNASWAPLSNVKNDASALAKELRESYGYAVTTLTDPTRLEFKNALGEIARLAEPNDDLLIYVGGHGYFDETDNSGHLVLTDADPSCERGCYPLDHVGRSLYATRALHVLVMLDTCYAGTIDPRVAVASSGESWRAAPPPADQLAYLDDYGRYASRLIFTSVGREVASDGRPGFHSPFMTTVLSRLARPGPGGVVSIDQIFLDFQDTSGALKPGVMRPSPVASARPHHPQGSFLFAQQLDMCDTVRTMLAGRELAFDALRSGEARVLDWGVVARSRWTLPAARTCNIWRWSEDSRPQIQCDLGQFPSAIALERVEAMQQRIAQCTEDVSWQLVSRDAMGEKERLIVRALREPSSGKHVSVSATCQQSCALSVTFE